MEAHQKVLAAELADVETLASASSPASLKRRRHELLALIGQDAPEAAELNAKLRTVLKGVTFNANGSIKSWEFVGTETALGMEDEVSKLAVAMTKKRQGLTV